MDRKRTVATATGVSAVLIAGSSAIAYANGIFTAPRSSRVGDFSAMQAQLVPKTVLLASPELHGAAASLLVDSPAPSVAARRGSTARLADVAPGLEPVATTVPSPTGAHGDPGSSTTTVPVREPKGDGDSTGEPDDPTTVPTTVPTTAPTVPTSVPVVGPVTTTTVAHSGPSTVTTEPASDDGAPEHSGGGSDD